MTTCFFFAYGIGQVVNGIFCARYNKKYLFPIVLFLSSVLNLLATLVPFHLFKYMWLVNGFLQAFLWSSIINILGDYLDSDHMTRALVIMGTSATTGTIFAMLAVLAFFAIINNLVKDGLNTWVPAILTEEYNMKDEVAILSSMVLPLLGTFCALCAA